MTVSLWLRDDANITRTDLAIVGGGICGISAALEAERLGLSAVLLERGALASGASGRNAGYLMRGMADNYATAITRFGPERARAIWSISEENLASLRSLGAKDVAGFSDRPSCLVALEDSEAEELVESHRLLREDGFESELLEPPTDVDALWRTRRPLMGLVNPGDAVCHPVRLARFLASKLQRTAIREGCEVARIESSEDGVELSTTHGQVQAQQVFVCTNAWVSELVPELRGIVVPRRGQMLAAKAPSISELRNAYYMNRGDEYLRSGPSGELLMGGARSSEPETESGDHGGIDPTVQAKLEWWLSTLLGVEYEVTDRWSGVMGFAPSHLPVVGPLDDPRIWVCAGFTGHGMSLGHLVATQTLTAMLGEGPHPDMFNRPDQFR